MPTSKAPQQQKHSTILRSGFGFISLQIQSTWIIISTAGRQEEVQIWRCGINAVYIVKPFSKALWSLSQRGSNQSSPQHWSSIKSASPRSSIFSRSCFIFICLLNNWSKAREEIHKFIPIPLNSAWKNRKPGSRICFYWLQVWQSNPTNSQMRFRGWKVTVKTAVKSEVFQINWQ